MKRIEDLTFTDDYMFGAVMHDPDICKKVLERILKIKVDHIEYPELQKAIKPYYESKGVRLDVYVKDPDKVLDIEMQTGEPADMAKRTRYYQSMLDIDCLAKGENYENLPLSYIIFFCKEDWLNTGLPVATFQNTCIQNKNVILKDGCIRSFLCSELWEKETDIDTKSFLKYLYNYEVTDDLTKEIDTKVFFTKLNEIFRNDYLSMNLHDHDLIYNAKKEGKEEKAIETARNFLKEGISIEVIARCTGLSVEKVTELQKEINIK